MTEDQEERLVCALEAISGGLKSIARTMELRLEKEFPTKREAKEATITYIKTDEELLREEQGTTGEGTTEAWISLGPREREFLERESFEAEKEKDRIGTITGSSNGNTR